MKEDIGITFRDVKSRGVTERPVCMLRHLEHASTHAPQQRQETKRTQPTKKVCRWLYHVSHGDSGGGHSVETFSLLRVLLNSTNYSTVLIRCGGEYWHPRRLTFCDASGVILHGDQNVKVDNVAITCMRQKDDEKRSLTPHPSPITHSSHCPLPHKLIPYRHTPVDNDFGPQR